MSQIDLQLSSFFHAWANQKKMLTRLDEAHLSKALQVKYSEAAASYITFLYIYLCFDMFCISTWTAPSSSLIFHYHFFHQICEPPALTWGEDNVCPVSIFNSGHHHRPHSILWPISPMTGNRTDTKTNHDESKIFRNDYDDETGAILCSAPCNALCNHILRAQVPGGWWNMSQLCSRSRGEATLANRTSQPPRDSQKLSKTPKMHLLLLWVLWLVLNQSLWHFDRPRRYTSRYTLYNINNIQLEDK